MPQSYPVGLAVLNDRGHTLVMPKKKPKREDYQQIARRVLDSIAPEAARFFLNLAFEQKDLDRTHDLLVKNQAGELSDAEAEELRDYLQVGLEIDLLRSKARLAIQNGPAS
jgi:hypothetical protein